MPISHASVGSAALTCLVSLLVKPSHDFQQFTLCDGSFPVMNLVKNIGRSLFGDFGGILIGYEGATWVGRCSSGMQLSVLCDLSDCRHCQSTEKGIRKREEKAGGSARTEIVLRKKIEQDLIVIIVE